MLKNSGIPIAITSSLRYCHAGSMTIKEKIIYYKESLDSFEDTIDKYKFLLNQGKKAVSFPEEYRQNSFKVEGCQAQVWLVPEFKNNLLNFYSDSDAFISKGMVTILTDIYGKNKPADILNSNFCWNG